MKLSLGLGLQPPVEAQTPPSSRSLADSCKINVLAFRAASQHPHMPEQSNLFKATGWETLCTSPRATHRVPFLYHVFWGDLQGVQGLLGSSGGQ